jgi:hypothetical protein
MLSAVDPLSRTVHLTTDRWEHIIDGHPEMGSLRGEVLRAIREPSELLRAPRVGEDWYYLHGAGPSQWLKVVVAFDENNDGSVLTAFPRRRKP